MNIGGLGARAALLKHQKPTKPCSRCGLRYAEDLDVCSHCGNLNDRELREFKQQIEQEHESGRKLGKYFIALSIIGVVLLMLSFI